MTPVNASESIVPYGTTNVFVPVKSMNFLTAIKDVPSANLVPYISNVLASQSLLAETVPQLSQAKPQDLLKLNEYLPTEGASVEELVETGNPLVEGTGKVVDIVADIGKVANVDDVVQIIKSSNISKWADADKYELMAETFKKADWSKSDIAKLQRSIAEESGWIGKYYDENMDIIWSGTNGDPNIDGFLNGVSNPQTLQVGSTIDRYGHSGGAYLSPEGTPYGARALNSGKKETSNYFVYEVLKPLEVSAGEIAPWFGQPGKGIQYYLGSGKSVQQLIDEGFLKVVKEVIN